MNPPAPGGAKTTTLFVTARDDTFDDPVMVHVVPLVRLTAVLEAASVWTVPVSLEAFAFSVTELPPTASSSAPLPAFAMVLLKLTVAMDGSAKIRSPSGWRW